MQDPIAGFGVQDPRMQGLDEGAGYEVHSQSWVERVQGLGAGL